MKLVFDIDGTLTDYNEFVRKNALDYFKKKYGMNVIYPQKLEIEEIFDMDNFFHIKYNCKVDQAKTYTNNALNKYWISFNFIKFSLFGRFRKGVRNFFKHIKKDGHIIEIHTSRAKSTNEGIVGNICRLFTYLQFVLNGIRLPYQSINFYNNDTEKIEGIIKARPNIVFEDKAEILSLLNKQCIKTICINGNHNSHILETEFLKKASNFDKSYLDDAIKFLLKKNDYQILNRSAKSDIQYRKIRKTIPLIASIFKPIILHPENIIKPNTGVVIAPNHRSTLDPIIITGIIDKNIHWAALKRFFDGTDSIFNNSKNSFLCKFTAKSFKKLEYFPIERKKDNPDANNMKAIKDMSAFLKNNQYIGIFPEGTTNKSDKEDFGYFDPSFVALALRNNSWIQPVTMFWIKDLGLKNKVIVNFGTPFQVSDLTKEEAYNKYLNIQKERLEESKKLAQSLT